MHQSTQNRPCSVSLSIEKKLKIGGFSDFVNNSPKLSERERVLAGIINSNKESSPLDLFTKNPELILEITSILDYKNELKKSCKEITKSEGVPADLLTQEFSSIDNPEFIDRLKVLLITTQNQIPYTFFYFDTSMQVFESELKVKNEKMHFAHALSVSNLENGDKDITEFFFVNSCCVGYGVTHIPKDSNRMQLQFNLFNEVEGSRFGRGRIQGFAKAILKERVLNLCGIYPDKLLSISKSQYESSPSALKLYSSLGFFALDGCMKVPVCVDKKYDKESSEYKKNVASLGNGLYLTSQELF